MVPKGGGLNIRKMKATTDLRNPMKRPLQHHSQHPFFPAHMPP